MFENGMSLQSVAAAAMVIRLACKTTCWLTRAPTGRRYHTYYGPNKNVLPTDEAEQDRLDLHHEIMLKMMNDELFKAPIRPDPDRILDLGTGTGADPPPLNNGYAFSTAIDVMGRIQASGRLTWRINFRTRLSSVWI